MVKAPGNRGKRYQVRLLHSPAGEPTADTKHSFGAKDLKALLGSAEVWRDLRPKGSAGKGPEEIGAELFRSLISGDIRRRWDASLPKVRSQGEGLRILLRLGAVPELENWPWELLYDREFLALSGETSVVRYLESPTGSSLKKIALPLRILVVVANPADCEPIDGEGEWSRLSRALKPLADGGKVRIERLSPPTLPALEKAMTRSWHIIHFVGHGRFEDGEGSLILEDGEGGRQEVPGQRLKVLLGRQKNLRLVVLNTCVGAKTSPEDIFGGVAQSLASAGVPAVLAMRNRVSDRAALVFAERFYESLSQDLPIDGALGEARRAIYAETRDLEWSTPVLYMRAPVPIDTRRPWRVLLAAVLAATALGGGAYRLSTCPTAPRTPPARRRPGSICPSSRSSPAASSWASRGGRWRSRNPTASAATR